MDVGVIQSSRAARAKIQQTLGESGVERYRSLHNQQTKGLWSARSGLRAQNKAYAKLAEVRRAAHVRTMKKIRPMGSVKRVVDGSSAKSQVSVRAQEIADVYPTDWWKASKAHGRVRGTTGGRGYYRHVDLDGKGPVSIVNLSTTKEVGLAQQQSTTIHEFGHRMQHLRPQVRSATQKFYESRTAGESLRNLNTVSPDYAEWEVAKFDQFKNPYMGREYDGEAFELFSMGMESITGNRFAREYYDEKLGDLIRGLLAAI